MWTKENRARYDRSKLRYPSDLTDEEWAVIGPLIPPPKRGGNKHTVNEREVVNGLMYILSTGCQWAGYDAGKKIKGKKRQTVSVPAQTLRGQRVIGSCRPR